MGTHRDFTPVLFFSNLYQCNVLIRPHVLTKPVPFKPENLNLKKFEGVPFECEQNLRGENIAKLDGLFDHRSRRVTQNVQGLNLFIKSYGYIDAEISIVHTYLRRP